MSQLRFEILLLLRGVRAWASGMPRSSGRRRVLLVVPLPIILLVGACGLFQPWGGAFEQLEFTAQVEVGGDTVHYSLTVRNPSPENVELTYGGCFGPCALRVYEVPSAGGRLRWDESRFSPTGVCADPEGIFPVPAGRQSSFLYWVKISSILGDSLPDGLYRLAVMPTFEEDFRDREVSVGQFTLVEPDVER